MIRVPVPAASDPTENSADWMELSALRSPDQRSSIASLAKLLRRTGSTDAVESIRGDAGSEVSQAIAEDVFLEIENRRSACGSESYPFVVENGLLTAKPNPERFPYILLLLMSATKPSAGHKGTAVLFEHVCTAAAAGFLGGQANGASAIRFGSPRKVPLAKLSQALDHLSINICEGGGCRYPNKGRHLGDEGLDIVAWRGFPDRKEGQLIAFGQCAGGSGNWEDKLAELDARRFVQKWLRVMFVVDPVRLFFVPRRIPKDDWEHAGIDGGVLFDRCRIVSCLSAPADRLAAQCTKMATTMLSKLPKL